MASSAGSAVSLIKAMLELIADRRTGVMDVTSQGLRTRIYFDEGKPLYAEDDAPGESFGRLLVRQGVITNDQFVRVIDEMTRAAAGNNQLRFGEVAVGLGAVTLEQVERGLGEQVCGIIARALQRGESQWAFETSPPAARPPRAFSLEINPAIAAALQQASDRAAVAALVAARPEELVAVAGPRPAPDVRADAGGAAGDAHAARMSAEQAFQKGLALLRESKTASAAVELRRASELQPESLEYQLYAAWAKARSYKEVPGEADQKALRELAEKAKRRDPLFAFGSYVIGQLAMWAGDEATAKKRFYEALRLDGASEASKMVRILARRPAAPPSPGRAAQPARGAASAPPPVPAAEPPAPVRPGPQASRAPAKPPPFRAPPSAAPASKAPPTGRAKPVVAGAALLATAAVVILAAAKISAPRAGLAPPVASPSSALSVDASSPIEAGAADAPAAAGEADAGPSVSAAEPAKAPPKRTGEKTTAEKTPGAADEDAEMGTVVLPPRAAGHRIFVDGRRAKTQETSEGVAPLRLRCGHHVVQIGSGGTPDPVELPCGGEVQLQ